MNMLQDDQQIRDEVLDPEQSFIVQAPAGSGKTELLTQRILTLLTRVNHPEEVLAITFTRKAAGEMRARLLESLRRAADQPCPEQPHLAQNWQLAQAVLRHDRLQRWDLVSHPNRLQIRTMDSLNARLVRQMPLLATLGAVPQVSDDVEQLYRAAARVTLQMVEEPQIGEAVAILLRWLDNDAGRVERLIVGMLGHRDQWLPYIAGGVSRQQLEQTLRDAVESSLQQAHHALLHVVGRDGLETLVRLADGAARVLIESGAVRPVLSCLGLDHFPPTRAESLSQWQGVASMLLKSSGDFRLTARSWNKNDGFPAHAKKEKEALLALSEQIAVSSAAALIQQIPLLPPVHYSDPQWKVVESLFAVLQLAQASLMVEFEQQGRCDHTEIAQRARHALGDEQNPTDLALRLDYQIRHLLVDEFQDTSHGQFDLLVQLTAGWTEGDGRTLFLVGDPMQSIYRFRHAEVGLFLKAVEEGVGPIPLRYCQLSANFRSESGIVEWVNRTFATLFPTRSDRFSSAIRYASSMAIRDGAAHDSEAQAAVTFHPQLMDDRGLEADRVVELVQLELSEMDGDGKVAILVRSRSHLEQITERLYRSGTAYRALEIESLGDRPQVRDLLTVTRALLHLGDREAWLALLRAPWCGLTLQSMLILVEGEENRTVWSMMSDPVRLQPLSAEERNRLQHLQQLLRQLFEQRGRCSLVRWITLAWRRLGGDSLYRQLGEPGQSGREADAFFVLLEEMEQGGEMVDLELLHQRLQQQSLPPDVNVTDAPRVEVMTIHKSKGLQFDTVIIPGLGRRPRQSGRQLLHWMEVPGQQEASTSSMELLLSPIRSATQQSKEDRLGNYLYRLEQQRGYHELSRLLYVAITRAERRVHLLGAVAITGKGELGSPASGSLLEQLWPVVESDFRQLFSQCEVETIQPKSVEQTWSSQPQRLITPWQPPASPPAVVEPAVSETSPQSIYQWSGTRAIHIGTVVHAQLQWMAEQAMEQWEPASVQALSTRVMRHLRQLGVTAEDREQATARAIEALHKVVDDPQGRFLLGHHRDARSEWSLTAQLDGELVHVTIDRTFVDEDGVRWIIDWKTSSHSGGGLEQFLDEEVVRYRPQLLRYARVLQQMEQRPQRLVLYFPLHQVMREVEL